MPLSEQEHPEGAQSVPLARPPHRERGLEQTAGHGDQHRANPGWHQPGRHLRGRDIRHRGQPLQHQSRPILQTGPRDKSLIFTGVRFTLEIIMYLVYLFSIN